MKKLSILVALILCVTIGGVYATWNYAQGNVSSTTKYFDAGTTITDKVVDTAKGTITVDTTNLKITIDDSDNDFYGEMTIEGYVTVTFTPNTGADATVATNGIALQYALGESGHVYGEGKIFTIDSTVQTLGTGKSFTIGANELEQLITLNQLYLPTVEDYQEFKTALHTGAISITVSEAPVTP